MREIFSKNNFTLAAASKLWMRRKISTKKQEASDLDPMYFCKRYKNLAFASAKKKSRELVKYFEIINIYLLAAIYLQLNLLKILNEKISLFIAVIFAIATATFAQNNGTLNLPKGQKICRGK